MHLTPEARKESAGSTAGRRVLYSSILLVRVLFEYDTTAVTAVRLYGLPCTVATGCAAAAYYMHGDVSPRAPCASAAWWRRDGPRVLRIMRSQGLCDAPPRPGHSSV
eukprot:COSAG01_NODE_4394_length_5070_cov_17.651177_4_plen_107_part_00